MQISRKALEVQLRKVRELESRVTFRLAILSKRLDRQASEMLQGTPINLSSYRFLSTVDTFDEISIADVSRFIEMDRALASRTAAELEALDFVTSRPDPSSKRRKIIAMTDAGRTLLNEVQPRFEARRDHIEHTLGPENFEALGTCLDLLEDTVAE